MDFDTIPLQRDIENHMIICFKPNTAQDNVGNISESESILRGASHSLVIFSILIPFPNFHQEDLSPIFSRNSTKSRKKDS